MTRSSHYVWFKPAECPCGTILSTEPWLPTRTPAGVPVRLSWSVDGRESVPYPAGRSMFLCGPCFHAIGTPLRQALEILEGTMGEPDADTLRDQRQQFLNRMAGTVK